MRAKDLVLLIAAFAFCFIIILQSSPSSIPQPALKPMYVQSPVSRASEPQEAARELPEIPTEIMAAAPASAPYRQQLQAPVEEWPAGTTYKCYKSVDWAEVCIYKNLCHDGNKVVIFDDTKTPMSDVIR